MNERCEELLRHLTTLTVCPIPIKYFLKTKERRLQLIQFWKPEKGFRKLNPICVSSGKSEEMASNVNGCFLL